MYAGVCALHVDFSLSDWRHFFEIGILSLVVYTSDSHADGRSSIPGMWLLCKHLVDLLLGLSGLLLRLLSEELYNKGLDSQIDMIYQFDCLGHWPVVCSCLVELFKQIWKSGLVIFHSWKKNSRGISNPSHIGVIQENLPGHISQNSNTIFFFSEISNFRF